MSRSKCIYCDSTSYGRPCLFSPTNTHAHMSDPGKCMYCGSKNKGHGCVYNPYGKIHIAAPDFLNRSNLTSEKAVVMSYLIDKIKYKEILGENYKSPLDRFYKRLRSAVVSLSLPLLESLFLTENRVYNFLSKQQIEDGLLFKNNLKNIVESLRNSLHEAYKTLPPELVEKFLIDIILKDNED